MSKSFTELVREMNRLEESRGRREHKHLSIDQVQTLHDQTKRRLDAGQARSGDPERLKGLADELEGRKTGKLRQKLPRSVTK